MKKVLTVAGSDSGGCAGIQADIKTISSCGVFAMSAITAVTSQNTLGVTHIEELSKKSIRTQIEAVLSDIGADAVKTGMLSSENIIYTVAETFKDCKVKNYVLDPVMVASSGARLLQQSAIDALIKELIPLSRIITPNVLEAEVLAGIKIDGEVTVKKACHIIREMGVKNVLIKGGHFSGEESNDTLYDGKNFILFPSKRIDTKNTHGTGCTYSAAIASFLAKGYPLYDAVGYAKDYITKAITSGAEYKIGKGNGPVDHFFCLR